MNYNISYRLCKKLIGTVPHMTSKKDQIAFLAALHRSAAPYWNINIILIRSLSNAIIVG